MLKHLKHINEELRIAEADDRTLEAMKRNLLFRLGEYKDSILLNVEYDKESGKPKYKYFENIDMRSMLRELNNELTEEFVEDLKVKEFLTDINETMKLKKPKIKRDIRKKFKQYYKDIESTIKKLRGEFKKESYILSYERYNK